jgi:hypothetical protein
LKNFPLSIPKEFLFLFFLLSSFNTHSQNWERGSGVGYIKYGGSALFGTNTNSPELKETIGIGPFLSAQFGAYLPIKSFTQNFTLGANIGVKFDYTWGSTGQYTPQQGILLHSPNYLTLRLGAGSNKNNTSKIGIGAGIGYRYSFLILGVRDDNPDDGTYKYGSANFLIELIFDYGRRSLFNNVLLRFETQVLKHKTTNRLESHNLTYGYEFSHSSISLIIFTNSLRLFN